MLRPVARKAPDAPAQSVSGASADMKLRDEVMKAAHTLEELAWHGDFLGDEVVRTITETVTGVRDRLARKELAVVVVGEKKAGKSTFLNAILGDRVLGTAVRECTGTVTFIRKASRPTYRAILRDQVMIEFEDIEAAEGVQVSAEIEVLRSRLGQDLYATACMENHDISALMAGARPEYDEASRRRVAAEDADREADTSLTEAVVETQKASDGRALAASILARTEQGMAAARAQAAERDAHLQGVRAKLTQHARTRGYQLAMSLDSQQLAAARRHLQVADGRLAAAAAAVPFFLRPAPWWKFWVVVLALLIGWYFRDRVKVLNDARQEHRGAQLLVATLEAYARVESSRQVEADANAQLQHAQKRLLEANDLVRVARERRATAYVHRQKSQALLRDAHRTEDLLRLKLLYLRAAELKEQFITRFRTQVHDLTDLEKQGERVVELTIGFPAAHLPDGIAIIDTPGVNTDNELNRQRAWDVIRREADGCILVSDLQQVVSRSTRDFLQELRPVIPHILLVMSKVDRALANAEGVGDADPLQQVEEARRAGVRRFAKEVGRAPEDVFSIAVAAEPVLKGDTTPDGFGRRFPAEVAKIFKLLESERTMVLGARAASAIRYCVQRIGEAEAQAEQKYTRRIAELETQRLPDPRAFQARQLAKVEDELQAYSDSIAENARGVMSDGIDEMQELWIAAIRSGSSKDQVKQTVARLSERAPEEMARVMAKMDKKVAEWSGEATRRLEAPLLEELRERYRIVQKMTGNGRAVQLGNVGAASAAMHAGNLYAGVAEAVKNFESEQFGIGAGGAAAGAVIGTMVMPGLGTAIGAAIGAFSGLFKTLDSLKMDCAREIRKGLGETKTNLGNELASIGPDVQRAMRATLASGLADSISRFESWINEVMAVERKQIEKERQKLSHLIQSQNALVLHDQSLANLQRKVAALSRGLCAE